MREGRKFGGFKEHRGASQQQLALKHRCSGWSSRRTPQNTGRIYQLHAEGHESLNAALEPLHKGNPEQRHLQPLPAFERHRRHLTSQPASPPTPAITPSQVLNTPHCQPAKSAIRSPPSPLTPGSRTGWLFGEFLRCQLQHLQRNWENSESPLWPLLAEISSVDSELQRSSSHLKVSADFKLIYKDVVLPSGPSGVHRPTASGWALLKAGRSELVLGEEKQELRGRRFLTKNSSTGNLPFEHRLLSGSLCLRGV